MCKISVVQPLLSPSLPDNKIISSISDEFSLGFFVNCCCYFRFTFYKSIFLIHTTFSEHNKIYPQVCSNSASTNLVNNSFYFTKESVLPQSGHEEERHLKLDASYWSRNTKRGCGKSFFFFFSPPLQKSKEHDLFSVLQKIRIEVTKESRDLIGSGSKREILRREAHILEGIFLRWSFSVVFRLRKPLHSRRVKHTTSVGPGY